MKRYIRIYMTLIRLNFFSLIAYRANFFNAITGSFVWSSFVIIGMFLLTSQTSSVFGWSRGELLVLSGIYNIIFSMFYFLFSENFADFSFRISYAYLDSVLLKPINSQFFMSCRDIGFNNIIRFISGIVFVLYMLLLLHVRVNFFNFLIFLAITISSLGIIYSLWFLVMTCMIWLPDLRNLVDLMYSINIFARYPGQIFSRVSLVIFILVFPFTLIAVSPAKALLNKLTLEDIVISITTCIILLFISHRFWKFALQSYTSASG